jgi:hypothetical protein
MTTIHGAVIPTGLPGTPARCPVTPRMPRPGMRGPR